MIGDFNIDLRLDAFYSNKLRNTMLDLGMKQYVNQPTRVTANSCTLIDVVFANLDLGECVTVSEKPKIMDHAWVRIELEQDKRKAVTKNSEKEYIRG